jgi:hypothetical protein
MATPLTALAAQPVPAYCTSGIGVHTPQQWQTCWNLGYDQPVTGAAHAGAAVGGGFGTILVIALIVLAVIALARRRSGSPATSKG